MHLQSGEREANPLSEIVTMLRDTDHAGWSTLCCDLRARALNDEKPCSWPTSLKGLSVRSLIDEGRK